jgi:multisubunit Na+/H+ antiporter MnhB subunit
MEMILIGIGISILTYGVERIKKHFGRSRMSMRVVVVIFCLIAWAVWYRMSNFQPELWYNAVKFVWWAFAASQALWMIVDKFIPKDK